MRTNVFIDDAILERAFQLTNIKTKKELVNLALKEFVENRSRKNLRDLKGKIHFIEGYDHKRLRKGKSQ